MKIIGLTGGIASGKSTVSNYLKELGAFIVDVDNIAREIVEPGKPAWLEIKNEFGQDFIRNDQNIDRKKLGKLIFSSNLAREKLNNITHPEIILKTQELIEELKHQKLYPLIVIDAPLLIEVGMTELVEEVWLVVVEYQEQIKRLMIRDNISLEEAIKKVHTQMKTKEKMKYASLIINNNNCIQNTLNQVKEIWDKIV
ncbi:dephospho-CoA kinase [Desulfonispora thiosulfatigenes DSM 11270]|uniref:Dephospho-CoA kinase n=1 Tax=Desulfonispora thiosulfatigenes DSM 11270 TaxID=656914 RepID=A0A1W1VJ26_DESTI|nr:dephospho-CoA kinase [Desulfonispora thiosulfatigenes]SMB92934.1 dephospho-CoA kinase [Desulfonispora thiosulfatigenes DSM 11270]